MSSGAGGAGGAVRAGAAYEAVLVDKVTDKVNDIVDSLDRLEQAFRGIAGAAGPMTVAITATGAGMRRLGQQATTTGDRFAAFNRKLRVAQTQVNAFGQAIGQASIHVGQAMMRMGRRANLAALGIGAFIATSIAEADRHRQVVASLEESWGDGAAGAISWAKKFAKEMRRNTTDVIEGLLTLRGVISGLGDAGKSTQEIDALAKSLYELGIDFASFGKGMSDEEGITKIIQALGGEAQELKRFGINVMDKDLKEYAETLGLVWSNLGNAAKMMLRIELLQKQMVEKGRTGAAFRERFGYQAMMKAAYASFKTFQKRVGQELEQFGISVAMVMDKVLKKFTKVENAGKKLLGTMVALAAVGTTLMVAGFALVTFGIAFLAMTAIAASAFSVISSIIAAGLLPAVGALLPLIGIVASIAMIASAFAIPFALAALSTIDFAAAIKSLGSALAKTMGVIGQGTSLAFYFASKGDWDRVWEAITLSARIAFIKLGDDISNIIFAAMMRSLKRFSAMGPKVRKAIADGVDSGGFLGGLRGGRSVLPWWLGGKGGGIGMRGAGTGQPGELPWLERRLGQLITQMELGMRQPDDGSSGMFDPDDRDPYGSRNSARFSDAGSISGFGASFARNTGLFRPQLSAQERGNQIATEQLVEQRRTNTILESSPPAEGLIMQ